LAGDESGNEHREAAFTSPSISMKSRVMTSSEDEDIEREL